MRAVVTEFEFIALANSSARISAEVPSRPLKFKARSVVFAAIRISAFRTFWEMI